jgi:hypothetical protein
MKYGRPAVADTGLRWLKWSQGGFSSGSQGISDNLGETEIVEEWLKLLRGYLSESRQLHWVQESLNMDKIAELIER